MNAEDPEALEQKDGTMIALYPLGNSTIALAEPREHVADRLMDVCVGEGVIDTVVGAERADGSVVYICPPDESGTDRMRSGDIVCIK